VYTYARGLCLSTYARGLCPSTHAQGLRSRSGALPFDPRSGASPTLGGSAFRPTLGFLAHARGLHPRSGAPPYAQGLRSLDPHSGAAFSRPTLGGFCPPDLRSGALLFCSRRIRHTYTIYTQSRGTDVATGLVHGAVAPWFALCRSLSVIIC
jgi:hypothetical protein